MNRRGWGLTVLLTVLIAAPTAGAAPPSANPMQKEAQADPGAEARAQRLDRDFRCLVCQSQSLADSDAPLAHDLRLLIRQRIAAGDSDAQIRDFLVARYGEAVLMAPPFTGDTAVLWLGPGVLLLLGVGAAALYLRGPHRRGNRGRRKGGMA